MRIEKGFTPITIDFDKHDLQLLVDALNAVPEDTPLQRQLSDSSVITTFGQKWMVNDRSEGSLLIERPTALTLNLRNQQDFDLVLDSFKILVAGLSGKTGPSSVSSRRIQVENETKARPTLVHHHKMLSDAVNKLCHINNPSVRSS